MTQDQRELLNLRTLPARLSAAEAAAFLGFQLHDIPVLVAKGVLCPLGRPERNGSKGFATAALQRIAEDEKALSRACEVIQKRWRAKNSSGLGALAGGQAAGSARRRDQCQSVAFFQPVAILQSVPVPHSFSSSEASNSGSFCLLPPPAFLLFTSSDFPRPAAPVFALTPTSIRDGGVHPTVDPISATGQLHSQTSLSP